MRQKIRLVVIMLILAALATPLASHASVVGHFTLIKGQVDVLKGGKVPGIGAKVQDGVETGDVIRTKSGAKAQLSMVDDSVITLAPESRLAIADYQYNPARDERRAVLRLFRGLVHTVVNRIIKTEEPDFIMQTHTATMGVRGTDWYTLLSPNSTGVYLPRGILGVRSNLSTLPALLRLQPMQFTQVIQGREPSPPQALTPEILRILERMMDTGLSDGG
jgi:ferric-dicitrate binding protein FerR (iron transport regulator)